MLKKFVFVLMALLILWPSVIEAASPDYDVPNGHFFTQAAGGDGTLGFAVVDDQQARFWSEFKRLGGVQGVGYPLSARFNWDGFVCQVMQKGVLQWRPEVGRAYFVNVFDQMSTNGKDDWLQTVRSTPKRLDSSFDGSAQWNQVIAKRQALLNSNPAIKATYFAVSDPLNLYGLPTSAIIDNGNHYVIRLQRAVIQQWKVAVPWAKAGQVTVANGGDVGREASLYPADAVKPRDANGAVLSSREGERPATPAPAAPAPATAAPAGSALETALAIVNQHRALAGAAPLTADAKLSQASQAHANYYVQNYGDKNLAGMGLHEETAGKPGFSGANWTDRAKAAGYSNASIDENMGLVGDPQRMIDWCLETINHRWNLLHPSAVHLGYGIATNPKVDVVNIGFSANRPSVSLPTVYPGPGQTNVAPSAYISETPDPAPGVARPLGFPITISFHTRDNVQFSDWALADASGAPLQVYTYQKSWLKSFAIIPAKPLAAKSTYNVRIGGVVNGQPFSKTWSFTTR